MNRLMAHLTREDYEDARAKALLYKGGYARKVFRNAVIDTLRKKRDEARIQPEDERFAVECSELNAAEILAFLDTLPEIHRDALLAWARFMNARDAAASLGISEATYKTRLIRARRYAQEVWA